jgi:hypothetical protein
VAKHRSVPRPDSAEARKIDADKHVIVQAALECSAACKGCCDILARAAASCGTHCGIQVAGSDNEVARLAE